MRRCIWVAAMVAGYVQPVQAAVPIQQAPTQRIVRSDASGRWLMFYQVTYCVPETRTGTRQIKVPETKEVEEVVNGKTQKRQVTEYKTVEQEYSYVVSTPRVETKVRALDPQKVKAFETDGKTIPVKKLKERLREDTLVVVSSSDQMIADYYAGLFKPGTIILALEPEPAGPPAPPAQAPPEPASPAPPAVEAPPPPPPTSEAFTPIRRISQRNEEDGDLQLRVPKSTPGPDYPKTSHPLYVFASRDGADNYKLRQTTENSYEVTGFRVKRLGSGKQMVPVKLRQTTRHHEITTLSGKDVRFFTGDGAVLSEDRVKEKLSREATILYSADGEPVDPFWLQNFKATTLVFVGPQLPGGCGPMPMGSCAPNNPAVPPPTEAPPPPAAPVESGVQLESPPKKMAQAEERSEYEDRLIELTNAERTKLNLPPLSPDTALMKLAQAHSETMALLDQLGHDLQGKTFSQRMEEARYKALRAGENVDQGQRSPAEAVTSWMNSPGHKANILQRDYSQIGVGMATSKSGKIYWTQLFAKP